jgi:hypothetical protein
MGARERFQFSLASLMMIVTVYAMLFGALRSLRVNIPAFVVMTLYFTAVVYGQWALFGGHKPYTAAFAVGGVLFVLGSIADLLASLACSREVTPVVAQVFALICGGFAGIGIAALVDLGLLLVPNTT